MAAEFEVRFTRLVTACGEVTTKAPTSNRTDQFTGLDPEMVNWMEYKYDNLILELRNTSAEWICQNNRRKS